MSAVITETMTINEVLASWPQTLPVFAGYALDTCCGGAKSLTEVAQRHGFSAETLIAELEQAINEYEEAASCSCQMPR